MNFRRPHDGTDLMSSSYLRTNSSYSEFLHRQNERVSAASTQRMTGMYSASHDSLARNSWRHDEIYRPPPPVQMPPTGFRDRPDGWREESSWRGPPPAAPYRSESWVKHRERIASTVQNEFEHRPPIPPPIQPSHEIWRNSPNLKRRNEDHFEVKHPTGRVSNIRDRLNEASELEFQSVERGIQRIRPLPPQHSPLADANLTPRKIIPRSPLRREETVPLKKEIQPKQKAASSDTNTPIRNYILPAEPVDSKCGVFKEEQDIKEWSRSPSSNDGTLEGQRSNWRNMPKVREESWMSQYKRRIETQKAQALLRSMERQKTNFVDDKPQTSFNAHDHSSCDDYYKYKEVYNEENSKFFFVDHSAQKQTTSYDNEDFYEEMKRKCNNSGSYRSIENDSPPIVSHNNHPVYNQNVTINPHDFVEELSDDEWSELGALVNDKNKKRHLPTPDVSGKVKRLYSPKPDITVSTRTEPPPSKPFSFFREEIPSVRSTIAFAEPRNQLPRANLSTHNEGR